MSLLRIRLILRLGSALAPRPMSKSTPRVVSRLTPRMVSRLTPGHLDHLAEAPSDGAGVPDRSRGHDELGERRRIEDGPRRASPHVLRGMQHGSLLAVSAVAAAAVLSLACLGWSAHVVTSASMNPVLSVGDVVVTSPARADEAVVGRIALIERPGDASTTMHRIVGGSALTGYTSRGDANAVPDVGTVSAQEVQGLLRLRIPWFGFPALW